MLEVVNEQYESVPIGQLAQHPRNPREGDVGAIVESIQHNGFYGAVVAQRSTGHVLAGNHRIKAAHDVGMKEVPVLWVDVDDETALRILLADNRTNDLASYNDESLADLLTELAESLGLEGTGYDGDDLDELLEELAPTTVDDTDPEPVPEAPATELGKIYELGPHRLMCGDSTDPESLSKLFDGTGKADMVWTDPPYGVSYVGKTKDALTLQNDDEEGLSGLLVSAFFAATSHIRPGAPFYIACGPNNVIFQIALEQASWQLHQPLVWVKDSMVIGHSDYHFQHESILYGWLPGPGRRGRGGGPDSAWHGDNAQTTTFHVKRPRASRDHPTSKPLELIAPMLRNSSKRGAIVLDLFAGSGSTLIAAAECGRVCYGMDLDPKYCDVIRQRYADHVDDQKWAP